MKIARLTPSTVALAASLICLLVYLQALSCEFVNWDDVVYVVNNPGIRSMDSDFFFRVFTTIPYDFYMPLTLISLAADYHFFGLNPVGYHLTNILFHIVNTAMVVLIADRFLRYRPENISGERPRLPYAAVLLLSGLLFGIHPLRVESVVWVTERKDVLNGLFTLGSILCYLRYIRTREAGLGRNVAARNYLLSLVLFVLSLMAKPSSIVLPFLLLVIDWYPLGRLRKGNILPVLAEKAPYLPFSLAIIAFTALKFNDLFHSRDFFPLSMRLLASGNALFEYFKLMIYPVGILPYYDLPLRIPQIFIVKTVVVFCFLCFCFYLGRKRRWLSATLLFFIIPLVPILPFLGNGASIALAARYTYLPSLMPSIVLAVLIAVAYRKWSEAWSGYGGFIVVALAVSLIAFYAVTTHQLIGVWKNSATMWSRVIANKPVDKAFFYRGLYYADTGNYLAAANDYTSCLAIYAENKSPDIYNLYAFRAEALIRAGRYEEAAEDLNTAIVMFPHKLYYYHRGLALKGLGLDKEADEDFMRADGVKGLMLWFPPGSDVSSPGSSTNML